MGLIGARLIELTPAAQGRQGDLHGLCRDDAAIGPSVYEALPREDFEDLEISQR